MASWACLVASWGGGEGGGGGRPTGGGGGGRVCVPMCGGAGDDASIRVIQMNNIEAVRMERSGFGGNGEGRDRRPF